MALRKVNNETINNNVLSQEAKNVEKMKAAAQADKIKYNNKQGMYIKRGVSGKNLKNGK